GSLTVSPPLLGLLGLIIPPQSLGLTSLLLPLLFCKTLFMPPPKLNNKLLVMWPSCICSHNSCYDEHEDSPSLAT
ncbi:hypothetical protein, partial [Klebsiella aerogenes]|uniref:hypothetical protein n=1 Tax=Klebsiella aerogenes TaxID=548 RepID=UPI001CC4D7BD